MAVPFVGQELWQDCPYPLATKCKKKCSYCLNTETLHNYLVNQLFLPNMPNVS
jgi:hypothetical protein